MSQIYVIFSLLKLWIAVTRHNYQVIEHLNCMAQISRGKIVKLCLAAAIHNCKWLKICGICEF